MSLSSACSLLSAASSSTDDDGAPLVPRSAAQLHNHHHGTRQQRDDDDALELAWYSAVSAHSRRASVQAATACSPPPPSPPPQLPASSRVEKQQHAGEDRLTAFSETARGFARAVHHDGGSGSAPKTLTATNSTYYSAGLWSAFLPAGLLWFVVYPRQRVPAASPADGSGSAQSTPPSWSWASIQGGHVYWDALWPRSEEPWPEMLHPDEGAGAAFLRRHNHRRQHDAQSQTRRFPKLDSKLKVLRVNCASLNGSDPFGAVQRGSTIKLRCCLSPVVPFSVYEELVQWDGFVPSTRHRVFRGCVVAGDHSLQKSSSSKQAARWMDAAGAALLNVWGDLGKRNDHLKLLFDIPLSQKEFIEMQNEILYCVKFFEYPPSSVAWGHHDGLLVRRKSGTKNEFERVGLFKCARSSIFDDKYQVIKLV